MLAISLSRIIFNIYLYILSFINLFVFMLQSVGGVLTHWSPWSPCSKSCGGGTRTRTRSCMNRTFFSFVRPVCSGHLSEDEQCNNNRCVVPGNYCNVNRKYFYHERKRPPLIYACMKHFALESASLHSIPEKNCTEFADLLF